MKFILYIFVSFCFSTQSQAANLINAGDAFKLALGDWENLTAQEQLANWVKFEAQHKYIYDMFVYRKDVGGWELRQQAQRNAFFLDLPNIQTKMMEIFDAAPTIVAENEARFKTLFSDLPSDIPVYFLPTMQSFNGRVSYIPELGRSALMIGVDTVVKNNDNLEVLFAHEFFHAYHGTKLTAADIGSTMASPLWKEGFATYISGVLNPEVGDEALLMDSALAQECAKKEFVADIAKQYAAVITQNDDATYKDWFMMSGTTQPTRRGYCLGLMVVRELAKTNDLKDMTTWGESKFSAEVLAVLASLAR